MGLYNLEREALWTRRYQKANLPEECKRLNAMYEQELRMIEKSKETWPWPPADVPRKIRKLVTFDGPIAAGTPAARMVATWNKKNCVKKSTRK